MALVFVSLVVFQSTPCYIKEEYACCRISFYVSTIGLCLSLALLGRFVLGTEEEIKEHYGLLELAFFYLFMGFLFYMKKFPECWSTLTEYRCV